MDAKQIAEQAGQKTQEWQEKAQDMTIEAQRKAEEMAAQAKAKANEMCETADRYVHENTWTTIAVISAVAAAFGFFAGRKASS